MQSNSTCQQEAPGFLRTEEGRSNSPVSKPVEVFPSHSVVNLRGIFLLPQEVKFLTGWGIEEKLVLN